MEAMFAMSDDIGRSSDPLGGDAMDVDVDKKPDGKNTFASRKNRVLASSNHLFRTTFFIGKSRPRSSLRSALPYLVLMPMRPRRSQPGSERSGGSYVKSRRWMQRVTWVCSNAGGRTKNTMLNISLSVQSWTTFLLSNLTLPTNLRRKLHQSKARKRRLWIQSRAAK